MEDLMIPEEYLLLRKEYLTTLLDKMPVVKPGRRGKRQILRLYDGDSSHYTEASKSSRKWGSYYKIYTQRVSIEDALTKTNQLLKQKRHTRCKYPLRVINRDNCFDSSYYDMLEDSSCSYEKTSQYYYKGRNYRSRAERQFALILDEFGLEFKYDVKVTFHGKQFTVDFVVVFREFNRCIFIEFYGKCSERDYLEDNGRKLLNAQLCGIYLNRDMFIVSGDRNYAPGPDAIRVHVAYIICLLAENHIEKIRSDIKI